MSFEEDKARLIRELADAQKQTRAKYGMAKREDPLTDSDLEEDANPGKRAAASTDES
ncbi:hypothetical protein GEV29_03300 [Aeromicrobium sp. SMF47]|uniref:hypothetical protein n=1 Tax=Aeromicrobium TaxID=2040 RepID=UPI00129DAAE0|nr:MULTISPECIES: hypothetical protein [Aeromicrobium]MRJ75552.1 hypothetical protein [Aeromicrobium yanjiei]MRJ99897.1 hypothetical protein [Aeromicrobium sp. S22]